MNWAETYQKVYNDIPFKAKERGFKKWFMDNESDGLLFDSFMIGRCYTAYKSMKDRDKDHFMLVVGKEGSGKSTFAVQIAAWIDPNFVVDNICFTPKDYIRRLRTVSPGSVLVLDEGGFTMMSREAMTSNNVTMMKIFMLQRQKNISVIVCCPSFWDVDTYIRKHRVDTLVRITQTGEYQAYVEKSIKIINELARQKKELSQIRVPNGSFWHGKWKKDFPGSLDREAYLVRKRAHLEEYLDGLENDFDKDKLLDTKQFADKLGVSRMAVQSKIKRGTLNPIKVGGRNYMPDFTRETTHIAP